MERADASWFIFLFFFIFFISFFLFMYPFILIPPSRKDTQARGNVGEGRDGLGWEPG